MQPKSARTLGLPDGGSTMTPLIPQELTHGMGYQKNDQN